MARGRLVSRTLGSSRKFAALLTRAGKLGEFAQSLYPLLIANSDDFGRMAGDAFTVKYAVFPSSPRKESEFSAALEAMHDVRLIQIYQADDEQLLQIEDFDDHQPGLHKRTAEKFPAPPVNLREFPSQSKGRELKGREEKTTALPRAADTFQDFWDAYPKKRSKPDAEKAWRKLAPSPELVQRMLGSIAVQRGWEDWTKEQGRFIPYPATWLRDRRWDDTLGVEPPPDREPEVDWYEECKTLHGGACEERMRHHHRMRMDELKAKGA